MKAYVSIIFLIFLSLAGITACSSSRKVEYPYGSDALSRSSVVSLADGRVRGVLNQGGTVELFAGIPFAAPPVGDLRWREPQPVEPWSGILEADHFKPMAMQPRSSWLYTKLFNAYTHSSSRTDFAPMSEDCLYLNVWRPASAADENASLPVLVYVHGGSLMTGSSWFESYDGESLASRGIVVVNIAYRTGVFGFFADEELAAESPVHTTGNYGLLDQIKALEWVHKNISAFGGNPDNVTIAGESAGSSSVSALCASPLSKGLFRRAIGESSSLAVKPTPHTFRTLQEALKMGADIKAEFKVSSINKLRELPAEKLIKTRFSNNSMTVDGYALPKTPYELYMDGENHEEALLNGFNAREGFGFTFFTKITKRNYRDMVADSPFVADARGLCSLSSPGNNKEAKAFYNDVFSAICFSHPHDSWSSIVTAQGKPVYEYFFTKENGGIGANHSGEMIYAYGNVPHNKRYTQADYELERIMTGYWLNFIRTGNPNGEGLPEWQTVSQSGGLLLELGENVYMRDDPFRPMYSFLE